MVRYPIDLAEDDNQTVLITCPDLPEVTTFAADADEAERRASDAIEEAVAARVATGQEVPEPSVRPDLRSAALRTQAALKLALYRRLRAKGLTRADLQRRLGWKRESVDRLFRFDHASRLDQLDAAFNALGEEIEVAIWPAA